MVEFQKDVNTECSDLNGIFAVNYILGLLDYEKFDNFLSERKIGNTAEVFEGFLFFAKTLSRSLLEEISRSWSLNLPENYIFSRALHRGVPLEKIKNSSKKVIFVKNLHRILRILWTSKDISAFEKNYKIVDQTIMEPIRCVLNSNVDLLNSFEKHGKQKVSRRLAILYALISLSDTHRGCPQGYFFSLSNTKTKNEYRSKVFVGYKLALSFIWKELLDQEMLQCGALIAELAKSKDWETLDSKFDFINRHIVEPLEKEFDLSPGFGKYFRIKKPISADIWNKGLFRKPHEPALSKEEDLQQELFWYPIQAMTGQYIFNGVATFASLLMGSVKLKKAFGNDEKTFVVRFVHPVNERKNDYSYAILVEAFGTIGDYSGWLVFYDCCGDYSGFAGGEYSFAESIIKQYMEMNSIEVTDYKISSKDFLDYLRVFSADISDTYEHSEIKIPIDGEVKKHKQMLKTLSSSTIIARQKSTIETYKGFLLELLAYYYFNSEKYCIKWRYRNKKIIGKDEIDIVVRDDTGSLHLVSCMSSFDIVKVKRLINESAQFLLNKANLTKDFGEFMNVRNVVFMPDDLTPSQRKESRKFKADFYSLRRLLREDPRFADIKKTDLERIFWENQNQTPDESYLKFILSSRFIR
jgi:hypothetical protein